MRLKCIINNFMVMYFNKRMKSNIYFFCKFEKGGVVI